MLNIITHVDLCLTTVSLNVLRSDAYLKEVMSLNEAGPSTFTCRSIDTVSGIKAICFFVQEMSFGQTETL